MDFSEKYNFETQWYDNAASSYRKFYLYYYPADNSVELFDIKNRKTFLRKTICEEIQARDIYVGSKVTIFSRCMEITNYADEATKNKLEKKIQKTLGLLKPDIVKKTGEILRKIKSHDFHVTNCKMVKLNEQEVERLFENATKDELKNMKEYLTSGPSLALELLGENAITKWKEVLGPNDITQARQIANNSFRALYGIDSIRDGIHGSENAARAEQELNLFFPNSKMTTPGPKNTAEFKNCTCCIIKPHAVQSRLSDDIISDIQQAGYIISAMQQFYVDSINAEEFLEVYKGVLSDYSAMVAELRSGPCIVMEITHQNENFDVHNEFRKFCGPMDPEIAKQVRPNSLRAKYGKTKVQNAIHCSDLPEDGILEVEYFFKILDK